MQGKLASLSVTSGAINTSCNDHCVTDSFSLAMYSGWPLSTGSATAVQDEVLDPSLPMSPRCLTNVPTRQRQVHRDIYHTKCSAASFVLLARTTRRLSLCIYHWKWTGRVRWVATVADDQADVSHLKDVDQSFRRRRWWLRCMLSQAAVTARRHRPPRPGRSLSVNCYLPSPPPERVRGANPCLSWLPQASQSGRPPKFTVVNGVIIVRADLSNGRFWLGASNDRPFQHILFAVYNSSKGSDSKTRAWSSQQRSDDGLLNLPSAWPTTVTVAKHPAFLRWPTRHDHRSSPTPLLSHLTPFWSRSAHHLDFLFVIALALWHRPIFRFARQRYHWHACLEKWKVGDSYPG